MNTTWNSSLKQLRPLLATTVTLLLITTVAYPLVVTGIGQLFFNSQANGSIITVDGKAVGSSLIGQEFVGSQYFQGRPSAAGNGYDASASSGSNLGPTSAKLINSIVDRVNAYRQANGLSPDQKVPSDAVTASASGLDPNISPANAQLQTSRVAKARGVTDVQVRQLVDQYTESRSLGFIGEPRVNVLKLNIALDARFPVKK